MHMRNTVLTSNVQYVLAELKKIIYFIYKTMCLWKMHREGTFLNSSEGVALSFLVDARASPLWSAMKNAHRSTQNTKSDTEQPACSAALFLIYSVVCLNM